MDLPDEILVSILKHIDLQYLLQTESKCCNRLKFIVSNHSLLWRHVSFDKPMVFNEDQFDELLKHSRGFHEFLVPGSIVNCSAPFVDYCPISNLPNAKNLYWLHLTDIQLSTLCFLLYLPNLVIMNISGCTKLVDEDFVTLKSRRNLAQLYVSFTSITTKSIVDRCQEIGLTLLDTTGVFFSNGDRESVLENIFCLAVVGGTTIQERSTEHPPPCFVDDSGDPEINQLLDYFLRKIILQINVLKLKSESRKEIMDITYCLNLSDDERVTASFLDLSMMNSDTDSLAYLQDFCTDTTSFLHTMRTHYDILNELAYYIYHLRKTPNDAESDGMLKDILHTIYDCMCSIKAALRSRDHDPTTIVPSGVLSDIFSGYRNRTITTCVQQTSEYVTVHDIVRIVNYLEAVYIPFNTTSATCH